MHLFNRWLPGRRWELIAVALLFSAGVALAGLGRGESVSPYILLLLLEAALPLGLGVVAAGLVAGDPALDLLLSVPQPASRTLLLRLTALLGFGLALALLALVAARWWALPLPVSGPRLLLVWASPALLLAGVATAVSLLRGHALDGVAATLGVEGMAILSLLSQSDCPPDPLSACSAAMLSPLMTILRPQDPLWMTNRMLWLGVGAVLVIVGLRLVRREEQLILAAQSGE